MEKVYAVIPMYNVSIFICDLINSLNRQTYKSFFVIFVDDGSTDKTIDTLILAEKSFDYHIIKKNNEGPSSARNAGLDFVFDNCDVDNTYIVFIDADDVIKDDYLKTLVSLSKSNNCDIVCSKYWHIRSGADIVCANYENNNGRTLSSFEAVFEILCDKEITSHPHQKLFKTSLWSGLRFPTNVFFLEDAATIFKAFIRSHYVYNSNYMGYGYRKREGQITSQVLNNRYIFSGWRGLYLVASYNFMDYEQKKRIILVKKAHNLFMDNYLCTVGFVNKKTLTKEEKMFYCFISKEIRKGKWINDFEPYSLKTRIKKFFYKISPWFYTHSYFLFKKR